jgi:hypothetical protein
MSGWSGGIAHDCRPLLYGQRLSRADRTASFFVRPWYGAWLRPAPAETVVDPGHSPGEIVAGAEPIQEFLRRMTAEE